MNILVACEFSGRVRDAFLQKGHDAMSCDLLDSEVPGPHYKGNMFDLNLSMFDLIIAHPPCTALCVSGNRYYANTEYRINSAKFIEKIWKIPIKKLVIENPVGVINTLLPSWQFGHGETKKTGLWKRGLADLKPTNIVKGRDQRVWKMPPSKDRWKKRSETYIGIANAMADQWGCDYEI